MPFQTARVAMDWLNARLLLSGERSIWAAAKTKILRTATKSWQVVMKAGRGLLDVGKLALYYGKQIVITAATKAWTAAQWLWNAALNANPIGLLIAAIAGAIAIGYTFYKNWDKIKAWWNSWKLRDVFAVIKDYAGLAWSYVTEKWESLKSWWDSWELADVFAPINGYVETAKASALQKIEALKAWWDSWELADVFAPMTGYVETAKATVSEKLESLKTWWDSWELADIFAPVIMYAVVRLAGLPPLMGKVFVVQASLPVLMQAAIQSARYNADLPFAAQAVTVSTLMSILAIPVCMAILS